ncbi:Tn3 family transposase [Klebsiella pneumoniae subsp. pneumoniae]|nr:Tn3 family transposase [Klebsiella pneumoniae subsp. pneumoniae]
MHAGLNKGRGAQRAGPRCVLQPPGEIRDRSFEQQRYRASGLNLVTAAIVLWNTVYLERAANALRGHGQAVDDGLLQYLLAARLGAHQPDRRLPLAQQRQDRRGQVQAATAAATGLACFI